MEHEALSLFAQFERHLLAAPTTSPNAVVDSASEWLDRQVAAFAALTHRLSALQQARHECETRATGCRNQAQQLVRTGAPDQAFPSVAAACGWQRRAARMKEAFTPAYALQSQWLQALAHLHATLDRLPADAAGIATPALPPRLGAVLTRELLLRRLDGTRSPWSVDVEHWRERLAIWPTALDAIPAGPTTGPGYREEVEHEFSRIFPAAVAP